MASEKLNRVKKILNDANCFDINKIENGEYRFEILGLLNKLDEVLGASEDKEKQLKRENASCKTEIFTLRSHLNELKDEYDKKISNLNKSLENHEDNLKIIEKIKEENKLIRSKLLENGVTIETLNSQIDNMKITFKKIGNEKIEFIDIIDKKAIEHNLLKGDFDDLFEKYNNLKNQNMELECKINKLNKGDLSGSMERQNLKYEINLLQTQNKELQLRLSESFDKIQQLTNDKTIIVSELQQKLLNQTADIELLNSQLAQLNSQKDILLKKNDEYFKQLTEYEIKYDEMYGQLNNELKAQSNYIKQLESTNEFSKKDVHHYKTLTIKLDNEIYNLKNDLIEEIEKNKKIQNELTEQIRQLKDQSFICSIGSPSDSNLSFSFGDRSITDITTEIGNLRQTIVLLRKENVILKTTLERILKDFEDKAPALLLLQQNQTILSERCQQLFNRLENCQSKNTELTGLNSQYMLENKRLLKENDRSNDLINDLSNQVKTLLNEINAHTSFCESNENKSNWSIECSTPFINKTKDHSDIISNKLVTFKNIEELQTQNQRLLLIVRDLSEECESFHSLNYLEKIEKLNCEIESLNKTLIHEHDENKNLINELSLIKKQKDVLLLSKKMTSNHGDLKEDDHSSITLDSSGSAIRTISNNDDIYSLKTQFEKQNYTLSSLRHEYDQLKNDYDRLRSFQEQLIQQNQQHILSLESTIVKWRSNAQSSEAKINSLEDECFCLKTSNEQLKNQTNTLQTKLNSINYINETMKEEHNKLKMECANNLSQLNKLEVAHRGLITENEIIRHSETRMLNENVALYEQFQKQTTVFNNLQNLQKSLESHEKETQQKLVNKIDQLRREIRNINVQSDSTESHKVKSESLQAFIHLNERLLKEVEEHLQTKNQLSLLIIKLKDQEKLLLDSNDTKLMFKEDNELVDLLRNQIDEYKKIASDAERNVSAIKKEHESILNELQITLEQSILENKCLIDEKQQFLTEIDMLKITHVHTCQISSLDWYYLQEKNFNYIEPLLSDISMKIEYLRNKNATLSGQFAFLQTLIAETNEKYQKELIHHADDIRSFNEESQKFGNALKENVFLRQNVESLQSQLNDNEKLKIDQQNEHQQLVKSFKQRYDSLLEQNQLLHNQIDQLVNSLKNDTLKNLSTDNPILIEENKNSNNQLWEIISFLRNERTSLDNQLEIVRLENYRLKTRSVHLEQLLNECRINLQNERELSNSRFVSGEKLDKMRENLHDLNLLRHKCNELSDSTNKYQLQLIFLIEEQHQYFNCINARDHIEQNLLLRINVLIIEKHDLQINYEESIDNFDKLQISHQNLLQNNTQMQNSLKNIQLESSNTGKRRILLLENQISRQTDEINRIKNDLNTASNEIKINEEKFLHTKSQLSESNLTLERESKENLSRINDLRMEIEKLHGDIKDKNKKIVELEKTIIQLRTITSRYKQLLSEVSPNQNTSITENTANSLNSNSVISAPSSSVVQASSLDSSTSNNKNLPHQDSVKLKEQLQVTDQDLASCRSLIETMKNSENIYKKNMEKCCRLLSLSKQCIQILINDSRNRKSSECSTNSDISNNYNNNNKNDNNTDNNNDNTNDNNKDCLFNSAVIDKIIINNQNNTQDRTISHIGSEFSSSSFINNTTNHENVEGCIYKISKIVNSNSLSDIIDKVSKNSYQIEVYDSKKSQFQQDQEQLSSKSMTNDSHVFVKDANINNTLISSSNNTVSIKQCYSNVIMSNDNSDNNNNNSNNNLPPFNVHETTIKLLNSTQNTNQLSSNIIMGDNINNIKNNNNIIYDETACNEDNNDNINLRSAKISRIRPSIMALSNVSLCSLDNISNTNNLSTSVIQKKILEPISTPTNLPETISIPQKFSRNDSSKEQINCVVSSSNEQCCDAFDININQSSSDIFHTSNSAIVANSMELIEDSSINGDKHNQKIDIAYDPAVIASDSHLIFNTPIDENNNEKGDSSTTDTFALDELRHNILLNDGEPVSVFHEDILDDIEKKTINNDDMMLEEVVDKKTDNFQDVLAKNVNSQEFIESTDTLVSFSNSNHLGDDENVK